MMPSTNHTVSLEAAGGSWADGNDLMTIRKTRIMQLLSVSNLAACLICDVRRPAARHIRHVPIPYNILIKLRLCVGSCSRCSACHLKVKTEPINTIRRRILYAINITSVRSVPQRTLSALAMSKITPTRVRPTAPRKHRDCENGTRPLGRSFLSRTPALVSAGDGEVCSRHDEIVFCDAISCLGRRCKTLHSDLVVSALLCDCFVVGDLCCAVASFPCLSARGGRGRAICLRNAFDHTY